MKKIVRPLLFLLLFFSISIALYLVFRPMLLSPSMVQAQEEEPIPTDDVPTPTEIPDNDNIGTDPPTGACAIPLIIPPKDIVPADDWKDDKALCVDPDPFNPDDPNDNNDNPEISNADKFNGNTSYYNYWYCHPRKISQRDDSCVQRRIDTYGESTDSAIHHCNQGKVIAAIRGWKVAQSSPYLVNFQMRVIYLTGKQTNNTPGISGVLKRYVNDYGAVLGRRMTWNFIMAEIKSGWTTFGMNGYDNDMEKLSRHVFQKTWTEVLAAENANGCGTAWQIACLNAGPAALHPEESLCQAGKVCSDHHTPQPPGSPQDFLCKDPSQGYDYQSPGVVNMTYISAAGVYRGSECKIHLAVPPQEFSTIFDPDPTAGKTKEDYYALPEGLVEKLEAEPGSGGCPSSSGDTCGDQNRPNYWQAISCMHGGSWRHETRRSDSRHETQVSCCAPDGQCISANKSHFLVDFRGRARYINGFNFRDRFDEYQGSRAIWNYIMGEVRTGNTTFGQRYTYIDDLNFVSQLVFNKPWEKVVEEELRKDCTMDAWEYLCTRYSIDPNEEPNIYTITCPGQEEGLTTCRSHHLEGLSEDNPPPMVCSTYRPDNPNPNPRGYLENVSCSTLSGWSCDLNRGGFPRKVLLFDGPFTKGKQPIAEVTTNIARGDDGIREECNIGRPAMLGFTINTPSSVKDGRPHTIYAYDGDSPTDNLTQLRFLGTTVPSITCN